MLDKLSCDAVKLYQLAQLHEIGLSQPLRPAQGPGGAEVEWWKLGNMVLGRACSIDAAPRMQGVLLKEPLGRARYPVRAFRWKTWLFRRFRPNDLLETPSTLTSPYPIPFKI